MTLQDKVSVIVDRYIADYTEYEENTTQLLDEAVVKMNEIKEDALIAQVDGQIASFKENFDAQAQNQHNLLQAVLDDERDNLFPKVDKTDDYAAKVANAIKFIEMEGSDLDDDTAYTILKDFIHDYDQMKLFKRMIEKQVNMQNISGNTTFPKTFGVYNRKEFVHNTYETLEAFAENIFLEPLGSMGQKGIYSKYYKLPSRSYNQQLAESQVVKLAGQIDEAVKQLEVA